MNVDLQLSSHVQLQLMRQAEAAGMDVTRYMEEVLTDAVEESALVTPTKESSCERATRFRQRMEAWTKLHPVLDHPIDDSRESIYEGRGE